MVYEQMFHLKLLIQLLMVYIKYAENFEEVFLDEKVVVQNGNWSANAPERLEIQRNFTKDYETRKQEIQNQTLKVTTVIVSLNFLVKNA